MAIEFTEITENSPGITLSDRDLLLHILAHVEDIGAKVDAMHEELEAARPMIERWQHSKINRLLGGWSGGIPATGGNPPWPT